LGEVLGPPGRVGLPPQHVGEEPERALERGAVVVGAAVLLLDPVEQLAQLRRRLTFFTD